MKTGNNPVHSSKITTEITSNNLPIDTMGTKRTHMDLREMERRASDTSIPQATHTVSVILLDFNPIFQDRQYSFKDFQ